MNWLANIVKYRYKKDQMWEYIKRHIRAGDSNGCVGGDRVLRQDEQSSTIRRNRQHLGAVATVYSHLRAALQHVNCSSIVLSGVKIYLQSVVSSK
jgi:hypothetical protein